jgi:valyl-tRNA synthetase
MKDFPKSYSPEEVESKWYALWAEQGYFRPEVNDNGEGGGEPYAIVIPPPNVTGQLHMGHALNATLHDILIRWKRMQGARALWLPGTDHAGIATQNVVERQLEQEGTDRHDMGRENFIKRVWQWREEYGGRIINQLKTVGSSCDWSRERFTMDEGLSRAVREVFVRLYEEGLVYRAERLINWCPRCHTALSDLEVEHEDLTGTLTYMRYPLSEGGGHITVATTRPETMLGDTAVAVNPEDERYEGYIGQTINLPLTPRRIPVVADPEVDPEFGTGAVKVTPAHDFNDEAIARRQDPPLPFITVIGEDGRMTAEAGQDYAGLDRYDCRKKVHRDLEEQGLIEKVDDHMHSVGHCYRCKTIIEPYSTPQWFVRIQPLADEAIKAVRDRKIRIIPESWENSYFSWMENIRDWCITRQIWWGHRVPVWYCDECGETIVSREDPSECTKCGSQNIRQDEDVLDTWFSSALWPFSTLGWPDETPDLKAFYPTAVLITGFDILFFWVARMIMMGLKFMGEVPFRDVYIHALVRDTDGQKMSKSKGNVIDPLTISKKYGSDSFRFTFAAFAAQGRDVKFDEQRVEGYRHFINKLWNATRFILMNLGNRSPMKEAELASRGGSNVHEAGLAEKWILSRLAQAAREVNVALDEYRFNDAASAIYQFTWHEFCDWYIEMAKVEMTDTARDTLLYVLDSILRLLHPIMPFVTEEIWQRLPVSHGAESIMLSDYPCCMPINGEAERVMGNVIDSVTGIRNIRGELNIPPGEVLTTVIKASDDKVASELKENANYIERLARAECSEISKSAKRPEGSNISVKPNLEVYVVLTGIDMEAESQRLEKELKKVDADLQKIKKKLANPDFLERAPKEVVEKEKGKQDELGAKYEKITESLKQLKGLA